ncbi:hypothetical protein WJX84_007428 [Apatococcus fuscideae]|uniref:Uncharacterized protein n=1 Tax=Apatococcus fuscideae TaxID=2026836 RepID=A0AAW1SUT8_9CHLO
MGFPYAPLHKRASRSVLDNIMNITLDTSIPEAGNALRNFCLPLLNLALLVDDAASAWASAAADLLPASLRVAEKATSAHWQAALRNEWERQLPIRSASIHKVNLVAPPYAATGPLCRGAWVTGPKCPPLISIWMIDAHSYNKPGPALLLSIHDSIVHQEYRSLFPSGSLIYFVNGNVLSINVDGPQLRRLLGGLTPVPKVVQSWTLPPRALSSFGHNKILEPASGRALTSLRSYPSAHTHGGGNQPDVLP